MRKDLLREFTRIYVLDLGGNVRKNPKLSGTAHNVFGIQIGVAITILVRRLAADHDTGPADVFFARVDEWWKRRQKYVFLDHTADLNGIEWRRLQPDSRGRWLSGGAAEFDLFLPIGDREVKALNSEEGVLFRTYSRGVATSRDAWMYSFSRLALAERSQQFVEAYNAVVDRWTRRTQRSDSVNSFIDLADPTVKWSRDLRLDLQRGKRAEHNPQKIRTATYRPFTKNFLFFDRILNEEVYVFPKILPSELAEQENSVICATGVGAERPFATFYSRNIPDLNFFGPGTVPQFFPFYVYDEDGSNRRENITDWALVQYHQHYGSDITKWDIFHYVYGLLHSPEYRTRYAENLKRDLPHIPFVAPEAFRAFVDAGRILAELHVGYESAAEYPLEHVERSPFSWRVERMKLSPDHTQLVYNESLTLRGIPPEVFDYKLGNRSALEWVIDQYRVKTDARSGITHDPNNPEDEQYIVRLIKQVVTVSLETVRIVNGLPPLEIVS
jgi:predicted helicase